MRATAGVRAFGVAWGTPPVRPFTAVRPTGALRPEETSVRGAKQITMLASHGHTIQSTTSPFPEPWLVVDIKAKEGEDCFRHLPYFNFHCDPKTPTVSCPQPNGHHRFEFLLMPGQTKEQMEDPATRRQGRGAAAARLHVQRAHCRALAGGTRAARRRRGAYDAAVHGAGDELGRPRHAQSRLEARRRAAWRRPETDRHL